MPYWVITGELGAGKTLVGIGKVHEYLSQNRPVATNVDINLEKLFYRSIHRQPELIRLPDKPTQDDMNMLGKAYEGEYDEKKTGLILLDEAGTWLNARSWNDPDRKKFIDWCIHARKLGWDLALLVQDETMIDKQVRDALCEYLVKCVRTDRMRLFGLTPPKFHIGKVYYGDTANEKLLEEKWRYRGKYYYEAYDTAQVFSPDYPHKSHCILREHYFNKEAKSEVKFYNDPKLKYIAAGVSAILLLIISSIYLISDLPFFGSNEKVTQAQQEQPQQSKPLNIKERAQQQFIPIQNNYLYQLRPMRVTGSMPSENGKDLILETKLGFIRQSELWNLGIYLVKMGNCLYQVNYQKQKELISCKSFQTVENESNKNKHNVKVQSIN